MTEENENTEPSEEATQVGEDDAQKIKSWLGRQEVTIKEQRDTIAAQAEKTDQILSVLEEMQAKKAPTSTSERDQLNETLAQEKESHKWWHYV